MDSQPKAPQQQQHIRPRIQRKSPKTVTTKHANQTNTTTNDDVEATRKKMESWMGLGGTNNKKQNDRTTTTPTTNNTVIAVDSNRPHKATAKPQAKPTSILKTSKYSSKSTVTKSQAVVLESAAPTIIPGVNTIVGAAPPQPLPSPPTIVGDGSNSLSQPSTKSSLICKDIVVERDPTMASTKIKSFRKAKPPHKDAHASIEGYVPAAATANRHTNPLQNQSTAVTSSQISNDNNNTTTTDKDNDDDNDNDNDPLIIDSLEGLLRAAGQPMPANPNKITKDTQMVEANISFSVMTQDQYETKLPNLKEEQELEQQEHLQKFLGRHDIFGDDDEDDETIEGALQGNNDDDDDDEDDDAIMELLLGSDLDQDDEEERPLQVKAFSLLWNALTNWMTHETVVWMTNLRDTHNNNSNNNGVDSQLEPDQTVDREWTPMVDRSDIGASRCAGVLAMLRLYIPQCMEELHHPPESRRKAEKRLNDLMRTFDYSLENPKLSASHWKAMACVLLDAVLIETRSQSPLSAAPPSVAKMGMSRAEFEYLSRKAVLIFE